MNQTFEKPIIRLGNSAGVVLPREFLGGHAQIKIVKKPLDIKKDIFELLTPYFEDIQGVFLTGSYARGESTKDSDVDVLVVTNALNKKITSGLYDLHCISHDSLVNEITSGSLFFSSQINEAKALLNASLLKDLRLLLSASTSSKKFSFFLQSTKSSLAVNKELLSLDRELESKFASPELVYSLVLRLRGLELLDSLLKKKKYSSKNFLHILSKEFGTVDAKRLYGVYSSQKNGLASKEQVPLVVAEKLLDHIKKRLKQYDS